MTTVLPAFAYTHGYPLVIYWMTNTDSAFKIKL